MNNPTTQELMEYVDGTLLPQRYREIELLVSRSRHLQQEVSLLRAIRTTVQNDITATPSKRFTSNVMKEVLPFRKESLWFHVLKNSSNIFAMVLVLSMIGIVLVSGVKSSGSTANPISKSIESYSTAYNSMLDTFSEWSKQYTKPVNQIAQTSSGKFFLIGLIAFFVFIVLDDYFGKKYFHSRIKH